jgi:serine/threonine-protein kinase
MAVVADNRIGAVFAGYRVEALLGRGGMSVVYRGEDLHLHRKVALKLLAPELAHDDRFRERFLRESELAASLDHPNILPVYEAGEVGGQLYIAMRYVEGEDLKHLLRRERMLRPDRALALVAQVGDALDAAHERGLVHRDVKPSNVLVARRGEQEHCYLSDFGLTKYAADRSAFGEAGQLVGTIDYVAPEQIRGGEVDARADVYALTCLLFECLTGRVPFERDSDVAVIYAHLHDLPSKASELLPELPRDLDAVLERGMAKAPETRWESGSALVDAARTALVLGETSGVRARRPRPRPRAAVTAIAATAAAAAVAAFLLGGSGTTVARADSLVRIDPVRGEVAGASTLAGRRATAVITCAGFVWVTHVGGTVSEIDPRSATAKIIRVVGTPEDVADVGSLAAVVSGPPSNSVTVIDASYGEISGVVPLPGAPLVSSTATSFGADVWVANPNAYELDRLVAPYTQVAARITLPAGPRARHEPRRYNGVAVGAGSVWVVGDTRDPTLWRVDPATQRVVATIALPFAPLDVAAGSDSVWLVNRRDDKVVRIDPNGEGVVRTIQIGNRPEGVAIEKGMVFVAARSSGRSHRGGTLTVLQHGPFGPSDPVTAGLVCFWACTWLKHRLKYDDSLDVFGVHGIGGMTGTLLAGVFATSAIGGTAGLIEGHPQQVLIQLYGIAATLVWSGGITFVLLKLVGVFAPLRVSVQQELEGLDISQHGEALQ